MKIRRKHLRNLVVLLFLFMFSIMFFLDLSLADQPGAPTCYQEGNVDQNALNSGILTRCGRWEGQEGFPPNCDLPGGELQCDGPSFFDRLCCKSENYNGDGKGYEISNSYRDAYQLCRITYQGPNGVWRADIWTCSVDKICGNNFGECLTSSGGGGGTTLPYNLTYVSMASTSFLVDPQTQQATISGSVTIETDGYIVGSGNHNLIINFASLSTCSFSITITEGDLRAETPEITNNYEFNKAIQVLQNCINQYIYIDSATFGGDAAEHLYGGFTFVYPTVNLSAIQITGLHILDEDYNGYLTGVVNITGDISLFEYLQIDVNDTLTNGGKCHIEYNSSRSTGGFSGFTIPRNALNHVTGNTYTFNIPINNFPIECTGINLTPVAAALWNGTVGAPGSGIVDHADQLGDVFKFNVNVSFKDGAVFIKLDDYTEGTGIDENQIPSCIITDPEPRLHLTTGCKINLTDPQSHSPRTYVYLGNATEQITNHADYAICPNATFCVGQDGSCVAVPTPGQPQSVINFTQGDVTVALQCIEFPRDTQTPAEEKKGYWCPEGGTYEEIGYTNVGNQEVHIYGCKVTHAICDVVIGGSSEKNCSNLFDGYWLVNLTTGEVRRVNDFRSAVLPDAVIYPFNPYCFFNSSPGLLTEFPPAHPPFDRACVFYRTWGGGEVYAREPINITNQTAPQTPR